MEKSKKNDDKSVPGIDSAIKMDNRVDLKTLSESGDALINQIGVTCHEGTTYVLSSQNVPLATPGTKGKTLMRQNSIKRVELKSEIRNILTDSKKLMFAIQVMKFDKCAEIHCTKNNEKYEILSLTSSKKKNGNEKTDGTQEIFSLEMMVQKTKFAQITIHKALVNIKDVSVQQIDFSNEMSLQFLTNIKIDQLDNHASITIYFTLKTLSLIFGNLNLFSSKISFATEEFICNALLPRKYLSDKNKMAYTKKYISQLIAYLIKQNSSKAETTEKPADAKRKFNDQINRLLMLGVTPCTIESLNNLITKKEVSKMPVVSEASVHPIEFVNPDENVYQISGKYFQLHLLNAL